MYKQSSQPESSPKMIGLRKSNRKFAEARKLDERELAQAIVDLGFLHPMNKVDEEFNSDSETTSDTPGLKK